MAIEHTWSSYHPVQKTPQFSLSKIRKLFFLNETTVAQNYSKKVSFNFERKGDFLDGILGYCELFS